MPEAPSSRLGLIPPSVTGDSIKVYPANAQAMVATLDPKTTLFDQGTRSSRPQSTVSVPGITGLLYRSADGGIDYDYGTGWVTVVAALFASLPTLSGHAGDGIDEGMTILYQTAAMATAGVGPWTLCYLSTLSGTSKWKVIAADPWLTTVAVAMALPTTGAFTTFTDGLPTIALPVAGDYHVAFGGACEHQTAGQLIAIAPAATGLTPSFDVAAIMEGQNVTSIGREITALGISGTLTMKYLVNAASASAGVEQRWIAATPIRVG